VSYSQQQFTYLFYIDDTVREGVLFYDKKENTALYLDKITQMKLVAKNGQEDEEATVATVGGKSDGYFYKDNDHLIFTQDLLKTSFLIEDKLPKIEWQLTSEKKEFENLVCYKATTQFRGRNWTVWYCPDIPIIYGPWKFYGLPGLIVEAKEETHRFSFKLKNYVLKTNNPPPSIDLKNFRKVSMKQMAENTQEAFNNMMHILSSAEDGEEVMVIHNSKRSGIESQYEWEE